MPKNRIYKFLYEKYLINDIFSISKENSIFSTQLIFSSEITLNTLSLLYYLNYHKILNLHIDDFFMLSLLIAGIIGLLIGFVFIQKKKLMDYINQKRKSNFLIKVIAIIFSIMTYIFFICNISRI